MEFVRRATTARDTVLGTRGSYRDRVLVGSRKGLFLVTFVCNAERRCVGWSGDVRVAFV